MSSEILRRAAALMRERAEAATSGPWRLIGGGEYVTPIGVSVAPDDGGVTSANAEHLASWHPAVALAVADWLEVIAETRDAELLLDHSGEFLAALAVATTYLGPDA